MTYPVQHISVSIEKPAAQVHDYAVNAVNLPAWASGLSASIKKEGDSWIAESPMGLLRIRFADKNTSGILDHYVTLPSGSTEYNPMRVIPNHTGSEIIFTLFRNPGVTDADFQADARQIEGDLRRLRDTGRWLKAC